EPPRAGVNVIGMRALVQPPLAANLMLEMLNRVGDEGVIAGNAGLLQRRIEDAAGRPDERQAGEVLLVAGLLADQHEMRTYAALAGHGLGRGFVKRAARALRFGRAQLGERRHALA